MIEGYSTERAPVSSSSLVVTPLLENRLRLVPMERSATLSLDLVRLSAAMSVNKSHERKGKFNERLIHQVNIT